MVPQLGVVELVRAGERAGAGAIQIGRIGGAEVLRLRDRLLPLVDLAALLDLPVKRRDGDDHIVAVMQAGAATFGIIIDEVFDTEEIVVKPVAPVLRHLTIFGGNTILGDGSVTMIRDPSGSAHAMGFRGSSHGADAPVAAIAGERRMPVLLFQADKEIKAVALDAVARMELFPSSALEHCGGMTMIQYRGHLMPVIAIAAQSAENEQPVLVFEEGGRRAGLIVTSIVDVVDSEHAIELSSNRPGVIGTAVIAGRATEIIDHAWWLARASDPAGGTSAPWGVVADAGRSGEVEAADLFKAA